MKISHAKATLLSLILVTIFACKDAADLDVINIDAVGNLVGTAFLDLNGTGSIDGNDTILTAISIRLFPASGSQIIEEAVTDTFGQFLFEEIPVGSYRLGVDPAVLGDSLEVVGEEENVVTLTLGETAQANFLLSHPFLSIDEIRTAEEGRTVFTSGIALNARVNFGDGVVHLQGDSAWLRLVDVERANIGTGDSIRVRGVTTIDNGQPVLRDVTPFELVNLAQLPIPLEISTGEAASARDGDFDAALVRIREAFISDTTRVGNDFEFTVDDGSGPITVLLRAFLQVNTAQVRPDTIVHIRDAVGLLTPRVDEAGGVEWRLLPRGGVDVTLELTTVDLGLSMTVDDPVAQKGDQRTFTLTLTNTGTHAATDVVVSDSVPEGLSFVSSEASVGAYDPNTGDWTVGPMEIGATETLALTFEVTTDLVGATTNVAFVKPLLREVDTNPQNNGAGVVLTIVPPAQDDP